MFLGANQGGMALSSAIWSDLKPRQDAIETALRAALHRHAANAPPILLEAMAYSLFAPGKRLRPLLCLLACEAVGGRPEQSLPAGCAVEMIHTYSLIHDDLPAMDDDDLRRGLPTCHKKYGDAMAILAGDALLSVAFEVLATGCDSRIVAVSCIELASGSGAVGMVGGQVLDLQAEGRVAADSHVASLEEIHRRKTGALFRSSLRLGIYSACLAPETQTAALANIDRYADAFGLAFQVTDDLLDVESSAEKTGKRVGKDAARGKLTYPGLLGVEESRRKALQLGHDAVAAARALGPGGEPLAALAQFVVDRDR